MARIVVFTGRGPKPVKLVDGRVVSICTCGLSKTFPFCSGAHVHVSGEKEGEVYVYDGLRRVRVTGVETEEGPRDPRGLPSVHVVDEEI